MKSGRVDLRLWTVCTKGERDEARRLMSRVHYRGAPKKGRVVACGPRTRADAVRLASILRMDGSAPRILGCAVLDTLGHGNPVGRLQLAASLGKRGVRALSRSETLDRLQVIWASRFAVDQRFQSLGLGTILARHIIRMARRTPVPRPLAIESLRMFDKESAARLFGNSRSHKDFLCHAGFEAVAPPRASRPVTFKGICYSRMVYYYAVV